MSVLAPGAEASHHGDLSLHAQKPNPSDNDRDQLAALADELQLSEPMQREAERLSFAGTDAEVAGFLSDLRSIAFINRDTPPAPTPAVTLADPETAAALVRVLKQKQQAASYRKPLPAAQLSDTPKGKNPYIGISDSSPAGQRCQRPRPLSYDDGHISKVDCGDRSRCESCRLRWIDNVDQANAEIFRRHKQTFTVTVSEWDWPALRRSLNAEGGEEDLAVPIPIDGNRRLVISTVQPGPKILAQHPSAAWVDTEEALAAGRKATRYAANYSDGRRLRASGKAATDWSSERNSWRAEHEPREAMVAGIGLPGQSLKTLREAAVAMGGDLEPIGAPAHLDAADIIDSHGEWEVTGLDTNQMEEWRARCNLIDPQELAAIHALENHYRPWVPLLKIQRLEEQTPLTARTNDDVWLVAA